MVSDWSSDGCSSDLIVDEEVEVVPLPVGLEQLLDLLGKGIEAGDLAHVELEKVGLATEGGNLLDRKSVV